MLKASPSKAHMWKYIFFKCRCDVSSPLTYGVRVWMCLCVCGHVFCMHFKFRCATNRWMGQLHCETWAAEREKNGHREWFGSFSSLLWLNWRDCGVKAWMELLCRLRPCPLLSASHTGSHVSFGKDGTESRMKEEERWGERRKKQVGKCRRGEKEKDSGKRSWSGGSVQGYSCECKYLLFCLSG